MYGALQSGFDRVRPQSREAGGSTPRAYVPPERPDRNRLHNFRSDTRISGAARPCVTSLARGRYLNESSAETRRSLQTACVLLAVSARYVGQIIRSYAATTAPSLARQ